ncbi:phosphatidylinositol kinase tor1, partial [Lasius niger]
MQNTCTKSKSELKQKVMITVCPIVRELRYPFYNTALEHHIQPPTTNTELTMCRGYSGCGVGGVAEPLALRYRNEHVQSVEVNPPYGQAQDS